MTGMMGASVSAIMSCTKAKMLGSVPGRKNISNGISVIISRGFMATYTLLLAADDSGGS
jgi:hypothetical protein